jgi:hypothetical protein
MTVTSPSSGSPTASPTTGTTVAPRTLSAETRAKLDAVAKAWVLAIKKLYEAVPVRDPVWVQPVADATTTDQLQVGAVVQAFTSADAADKQRQSERSALEAFAADALQLIKNLALEAPADAQQVLEGHKAKLQQYIDQQKAKAVELEKSVTDIGNLINEISKAAGSGGSKYPSKP